MIHLLLLSLAVQSVPSHRAIHPAGVDLFVESPDVAAAMAAYTQAPMARMFADDEALGGLRSMLAASELTGTALLQAGIEALPSLPPEVSVQALGWLENVHAASFSFSGQGVGEPGALAVFDWSSEAEAEDATRTLSSIASAVEGMWVAREGARVALGAGSVTGQTWQDLQSGALPSLASDRSVREGDEALGANDGVLIARGHHRRDPFALIEDVAPELLGGGLAPLETVGQVMMGPGEMHWRMSLSEGRFITKAFQPGQSRPIAQAAWLGARPLDPALLAGVHPDALLVVAATLEAGGLRVALSEALGVELQDADVLDKIGPNAVLFVQPMRGIGLPRAFVIAELSDGETVLDDLAALMEQAAAGLEGFRVKATKYKDVPYLALTLPPEIASAGDLGTLRPTLSVMDGRLLVTNGSLSLKKEIRRRLGVEKDQLPAADYPWTRAEGLFPAGTTLAIYVDWAAQVEGLFSLARTFGPMLADFAGDLPFDLTELPASESFTKYMPPTIHLVAPGEAGGQVTHHEAGFAFETWGGLLGLGSIIMEALVGGPAPSSESGPEAPPTPAPEQERDETIGALEGTARGRTGPAPAILSER